MNDLRNELEIILGRAAIENDMQVPYNVVKMARAINYLATQLSFVAKDNCDYTYTTLEALTNATEMLRQN